MNDLAKAQKLLEQSAAPFDEACTIIRELAKNLNLDLNSKNVVIWHTTASKHIITAVPSDMPINELLDWYASKFGYERKNLSGWALEVKRYDPL